MQSSSMSSALLLVVIRATFLALLLFQDEAAADNSQYTYGAKNGEYYLEMIANVSPGKTVDATTPSTTTTVESFEKKHQQATGLFDAYHTYFMEADNAKDRVLLRREEATSVAIVDSEEKLAKEEPINFRQCIRNALEEEEALNSSSRKPEKRKPNRGNKKDTIMTVRKLQDGGNYNPVSEAGKFVELYNDLSNIFNDHDNEEAIEYGYEEDDDNEDEDDDDDVVIGDNKYHLKEEDTGYNPTEVEGANKKRELYDEDTELPTGRSADLEAKVRRTITLCYCLNLNSLVVMHATVDATSCNSSMNHSNSHHIAYHQLYNIINANNDCISNRSAPVLMVLARRTFVHPPKPRHSFQRQLQTSLAQSQHPSRRGHQSLQTRRPPQEEQICRQTLRLHQYARHH